MNPIVHTGPVNDAEPDYIQRNRKVWDRYAAEYVESAERAWAAAEPNWGIWGVPEVEPTCCPTTSRAGTSSSWAAGPLTCPPGSLGGGQGHRHRQLTGPAPDRARLQAEHGLEFPLLLGYAESVPPDASFDLAISEYGAAIWADPYRWIPEASRLLRPGGELIFLGNSVLVMLAIPDLEAEGPATDRLLRPQFGMHRFEWADEDSVEFHCRTGT